MIDINNRYMQKTLENEREKERQREKFLLKALNFEKLGIKKLSLKIFLM
jgi:hypothetical protein